MKILLAHNRYRSSMPSGESRVVDRESAALSALGHEVLHLERQSDEIETWSPVKKASLPFRVVYSGASRREMRRTLQETRPDVVHVHNTFPLLTPSILFACRDEGVPVVATLHNYKLLCANGEFFRQGRVCHDCADGSLLPAVRNGCYRGSAAATLPVVTAMAVHRSSWRSLVSAYICISESERTLLAGLGLPEDRVFVKHNFLPGMDDATVSSSGAREDLVAYVGRVDAGKGVPFLLRAWEQFVRARPDSTLRLAIAGSGPLSDEVARWAEGQPRVDVLGLVTSPEAAALLGRARAVVLPSQWEESFGLVAVEAMAAGAAAIAADHGSFPELVVDRRDGRLFDHTDPGSLAAVLGELVDEPDRFEEYGRHGHRSGRLRFHESENVRALLRVYEFARAHPAGASSAHELVHDTRVSATPSSSLHM